MIEPDRKPLTKRQGEVLDFIKNYLARYSVSPTIRDIAEHFGFRSHNAAAQHVQLIEAKGWLIVRRRSGTEGHLGCLARGVFPI